MNKIKRQLTALTGMAQWVRHHLINQKVTGLIPSQGACLGCMGQVPGWGMCERQLIDISFPLSPSLPLSLKINKIFKRMIIEVRCEGHEL